MKRNISVIVTILLIIVINVVFLIGYFNPRPINQTLNEIKYSPIPSKELSEDHVPQEKISFVTLKEFNKPLESSVYGDVLAHSPEKPFGDAHGRSTNVHETAHGIHSFLRNNQSKPVRCNAFYCLNGRAVILEEPHIRKSQIIEFLPPNLRGYRFNTYITGQQAWDDTPLYIYDEWVAYILGGECNVQDVKNGKFNEGWTDGVSGCLSFSIYAVATCMAIKKYDPQYWASNTQFRLFTIYMLKQAYNTFMVGREMEEFKWDKQDKLYDQLMDSEQAKPMREFIKDNLDGVWLNPTNIETEYRLYQTADPNSLH